ncbi:uncharacterized protein LOC144642725 [Oculina patagonica]
MGHMYRSLGMKCYYLNNFKKALEYHNLHLSIVKEVEDRAGEGIAYSNLALVYHKLSDFKRAIEYHLLHLSIAKEVGDRAGEGSTCGNLGCAYRNLGDFRKALEYHQLHLNIAKEMKDRDGEGSAYGNLGNAYRKLGEFHKAVEYNLQRLSIVKEMENRAEEGGAYANLGNSYYSLGDIKNAMKCHLQDLAISKEVGDKAGIGRANANLGIANECLGEFKKAIEYHQLHLSITEELGNKAGQGCAYGNLGNAYDALGDFKKAIYYHQLRLNIAKEVGDRHLEGGAYGGLGIAYGNLGDFKKAIEYHQLDLSIAKEVGDRCGEGSTHANLGTAYRKLGDVKKAIEHHQQHLRIAIEVGDRAGEGRAYANLGVAHCGLSDYQKAIEYHQQDLCIAKEVGDRAGEGHAFGNLGNAYHSLGNYKKAIEYHQLHLTIAKDVEDRSAEGIAYSNLGRAYYSLGDLCKAEEFYKSSVRVLDDIGDLLQSKDEWKISLRHYYKDRCTCLWMIQLQQDKIDQALRTAEQGRGQALMELMESQYSLKLQPRGSSEKMGTIANILNYISSQTVFLAVGTKAINFWILQKGKEPHFVNKKFDARHLKENATTTVLSLNEEAYSEIGVLKSIKCENRSLDESMVTEKCADQKSDDKGSMPSDYDGGPLQLLYDLIISPIADLINGDDVIIVPDGPLFFSSFAAFMDQHSRYLSETFTIRLIPTLTSLQVMAECPEQYHSTNGALLVGDPWLGSVRIKGKSPNQLPNAKEEVEMIGEILKIKPLTDKRATKAEVLSRLSSVALVHIAAHGKAETGEILLSPNPTQYKRPKEKDYLLTMEDVKHANLKAKLVVLSCCHSGRGDIKAEGVVGIARAFLGAGARSVLASLWAIDDEATLKFMEQFYQHLVTGESASKSLNQAMKWMRESEDFSALRLWAPFVLIGDDVTLDFGSESRTPELQPSEEGT